MYFLGRAFIIFLSYKIFKYKEIPKSILFCKSGVAYPLIGLIFLGNLLFILNFIFPISSDIIIFFAFILLLPNFFNLDINFKKYLNFEYFFNYILIPSILVISIWDTSYNYDAGYYHLLNQAWFRDSNLIVGMVNIFWPFGISSIYEYISAFLWIDKTFVLLHFIDLIFIHAFYIFLIQNILDSKYVELKNTSLFILVYSLLDNFGFSAYISKYSNIPILDEMSLGGRNGFIYIQGVGKQDIPVAILFYVVSVILLLGIKEKKFKELDLFLISFFVLFIYQLKVSGILISFLYLVLIYTVVINKNIQMKKIIYLNIPIIFFAMTWSVKNLFSSGCFLFPVSFTCFEGFSWYIKGSTETFEAITTQASLAYKLGDSFQDWLATAPSFEFRTEIFLNFLFSIFLLFIIKNLIFNKTNNTGNFSLILYTFIIINFLYLLFFGPIPRYAIGICMLTAASFGFFTNKLRFRLNRVFIYLFIFVSVFSLPRLASYESFIVNDDLKIFDPRTSNEINYVTGFTSFNENWVFPSEGDQCWANTRCTMSKVDIKISKNFFKVAEK